MTSSYELRELAQEAVLIHHQGLRLDKEADALAVVVCGKKLPETFELRLSWFGLNPQGAVMGAQRQMSMPRLKQIVTTVDNCTFCLAGRLGVIDDRALLRPEYEAIPTQALWDLIKEKMTPPRREHLCAVGVLPPQERRDFMRYLRDVLHERGA